MGLNPLKWVFGLKTMASALKWEGDSKPAKVVVVPRDPSKEIKVCLLLLLLLLCCVPPSRF